jgi:hypothetical protein
VNHTHRRLALSLLGTLLLAGCGATTLPDASPVGREDGSKPTPVPTVPTVPVIRPVATPEPTPPTPGDDSGNVVPGLPELSVEQPTGLIRVAVRDPEARAWRLALSGTAARAADRFELELTTSDVGYAAGIRFVVGGTIAETFDLSGMIGEPTVAIGGCHPTLGLCFGSEGLTVPDDGDGMVGLTLEPTDRVELEIRAGSARWVEPFILGPWHDSEALRTVVGR